MSEITDHFDKALGERGGWGGTLVATCRCGREHFATGDQAHYDPDGELERLRERAAADPAKTFEHADTDSVGVVTLSNLGTCVWGCPCKTLETLEKLLWNNREPFLAYYRARLTDDIQKASDLLAPIPKTPK